MRLWASLFVFVLLLSCGQTEKKKEIGVQKKVVSDTLVNRGQGYSKWDTFWAAFKGAALRKDTNGIVELTSFPFMQNSFPFDAKEFAEDFAVQAFKIKITSKPVYLDVSIYSGREDTTGGVDRKLDSVYSVYFPNMELYFARINGYYKF